jgi:hypothetical protein
MRRITLGCAACLGIFSAILVLGAQDNSSAPPRIENGHVERRPLSGPLSAELKKWAEQSAQPEWVGYRMAEIPGNREACCENYGASGKKWGCGTCRLESGDHGANVSSSNSPVKLEGPRNIAVLFRAENNHIMKIRALSEECTLDAGGLPFVWLTGVKPAESVEVLSGYVRGAEFAEHDGNGLGHSALAAIALHADAAADRALETFVAPDQRESLRKQTAFWLGAARGQPGFITLQKMANADPSSDVRSQVTFAFFVSHEPTAIDEMIRMAKNDNSTRVRGQALFWLAQKAGQKAVGTITAAIENDPDTEVKKKAVFALSQLPKDDAVPKLIEVAQTNRNTAVRKQAMFWLGQSNDPRALAFFEKVLTQ